MTRFTSCVRFTSLVVLLGACGGAASKSEERVDRADRKVRQRAEAMAFTPCGGNVIGKYVLNHDYLLADNFLSAHFEPRCPQTEIAFDEDLDGTLSLTPDGGFSTTYRDSGETVATLPVSCLGAFARASCEDLAKDLPLPGACVDVNGACRCTMPADRRWHSSSGTYRTSGDGRLTIDPSGNGTKDTATFTYCASDGRLLINHDGIVAVARRLE